MGRLVCIHGIGDPAPDYWKEWSDALRKAIGDSNAYDGAYWEDLVEGRKVAVRTLARGPGRRRAASREEALRTTLQTRIHQNERRLRAAALPGPLAETRGGIWDYVGDFVKYLVDEGVRTRVQERVRAKLLEDDAAELSVVAHSWGTVVAYDVLHRLARERPRFTCLNLFTFGSPLWIEPVRAILADGGDHRKPANATHWINIYNQWDPVGPSLVGGLDGFFDGTLDRDERAFFLAWNPHGILNYLRDSAVGEILREALRGLGVRVFLKAPHLGRKAVLVGLNNYGVRAPKLNGCVNDALQMADLLRRRFGFEKAGLRLLTDERATRAAILDRLEWLVSDVRDGDELVFHFSGHGSQVADRNGDEPDRLDEIICPYDMDWDRPLTDDVLARYFDPLPKKTKLTVVLDSCHSGTGIRDVRPQAVDRFLLPPPDIRHRAAVGIEDLGPYFSVTIRDPAPQDPAEGPRRLFRQARPRGGYEPVLVAACKATETSIDLLVDRDYHGALTYALVKAVDAARGRVTYRQLIRRIRETVTDWHVRQTPQLEGPTARLGSTAFRQDRPERRRRRPPKPQRRRPRSRRE